MNKVVKLSSGITLRLIITITLLWIIKKNHLLNFTGLRSWTKFKNLQAIAIALVIILMGIISNWQTYSDTRFNLMLLFILSTLLVGVTEELVFRGVIFPSFIQILKKGKYPILASAVSSSLIFGLLHFLNLFGQPDNISGITSQVLFATVIGVFFSGLMVRTENIIIPIIIHALVNFSFGAGELKQTIQEIPVVDEATGINWNSIIPTFIFFSFIFAGGVYMILKSHRNKILSKLEY